MKGYRSGKCAECGVILWTESYSYPSVEDDETVISVPISKNAFHICAPKAGSGAASPAPGK